MMIERLTLQEILEFLKATPEQCLFDWKRDLVMESEKDKAELVKDIAAVANATTESPGHIFYGLVPGRKDPIVGIGKRQDDADLQQLLANKVDPPVRFLYYEVSRAMQTVAVVHVPPSDKRPHIISKDFGGLRQGQIPVRSGSSTRGIRWDELYEIFLGQSSPYLQATLNKLAADAMQKQAWVAKMRELRVQQNDAIGLMEILGMMPPGSLGSV